MCKRSASALMVGYRRQESARQVRGADVNRTALVPRFLAETSATEDGWGLLALVRR